MQLHRRRFLCLLAGVPGLVAVARTARAQAYPSRPVRIMVGAAPGGGPDIVARLMGQWLSDRLGQPFIVENKPGGGTKLATEEVVKAPPDGYTLLLLVPSNAAINASLHDKPSYDFARDLTPVAAVSREPEVMVVNPAFPATTAADFISHAKANPGTINMASPGIGSGPHLAGELFKYMAGIAMTHVAYRGSAPAIADLLAGQVQVYFAPVSTAIAYVRSGKLRALGVTTAARAAALPEVPPLGDVVPGYKTSTWYGIGAPKQTPAEIIDRLNQEINASLADPGVTARLAALGSSAFPVSPAEFGKFIAAETEKWAKVIKFAQIKLE
jgi:tripartite-type tricarboxylate transporter receptor subunit TctC